MNRALVLEGTCWKFGHNIPTDMITPTHLVFRGVGEMALHVLAYNIKRAMRILGVGGLIEAIRA